MGYETEMFTEEEKEEFDVIVKRLCEWIKKHGHSHIKVLVAQTHAEIVEGVYGTNT